MGEVSFIMKILLINKYLYPKGGAETYVFKLGRALWEAGHEVQFFGMADSRNEMGNEANAYAAGIDFHKKSASYLTYPFKIIYSHGARKQLKKVLDDFKPDVAHLNNFNYQLTPSIVYELKKRNIPIVYTAHDVQLVCPCHNLANGDVKGLCRECYGGRYMSCVKHRCVHNSRIRSTLGAAEGYLYRKLRTYRNIDKIICPSKFMENELCQNPDIAGRTVVLHNFIDDIKPSNAEKKNYVVYFGRYSEEKGIKTLLKAVHALPHVKFAFCGNGTMESEVNGETNIKNLGFLSGAKLNAVIEQARFSVIASECSENCPFSVMESQTLLTPVLGANIGGIPELIDEGKTGMLFESGNAGELAAKIDYLWKNPDVCREMSKSCENTGYDTVKEYTGKITAVYEDLIRKDK